MYFNCLPPSPIRARGTLALHSGFTVEGGMALGRHQGLPSTGAATPPHPTPPLPKRNKWTLLGRDRPSLTCNQTLPTCIVFCPQQWVPGIQVVSAGRLHPGTTPPASPGTSCALSPRQYLAFLMSNLHSLLRVLKKLGDRGPPWVAELGPPPTKSSP